MSQPATYKVIISGGGTGGHIFPAIAIADGLRQSGLSVEILFVGAKGRMEMEKVPAAGYSIKGLDIAGFQRSMSAKNLSFPFKVIRSLLDARRIIADFQPHLAIGVGGYASGPLLFAAGWMGVPTLIQEQNSYPGVTNKILAGRAQKICVAYPGMEQFFPAEKIVYAGNPVRSAIAAQLPSKEESCAHFGLDPKKPVVLSFGGSLGALTLNSGLEAGVKKLADAGIQCIWQTGSFYYKSLQAKWQNQLPAGVQMHEFLKEMHFAYGAADVIISRAGALSISELCLVAKAVILVPSPNVAEDHQTKNAMALVNRDAAIMIKDSEARHDLVDTAIELIRQPERCASLGANIRRMAKPDATHEIVEEILNILQR
jgi:UDP-N-acetylglucosamine--N-acetylmuramyl-(pentapeptide) pyrophosphoryl-undecaprenol N-acetylglucosamine transferase